VIDIIWDIEEPVIYVRELPLVPKKLTLQKEKVNPTSVVVEDSA